MRSCIKPCKTTMQCLHLQFAVSKEMLVDGGYLKLTAGRGLYILRNLYHLIWIEIETHYCIV